MNPQIERFAEQLTQIDAEIEEMRSAFSSAESASQVADIEGAIEVALRDRASTVETLEILGMEDPDE